MPNNEYNMPSDNDQAMAAVVCDLGSGYSINSIIYLVILDNLLVKAIVF